MSYIFLILGQFSDGDEYRLLFIPIISIFSILLLKTNYTGFAKIILIFGSLFLFSYFSFFFGNVTFEAVLLNPIIIITFSAFSSFIFKYKPEKLFYLVTLTLLFLLLVFYQEILIALHPSYTYLDIVKEDIFVVRLAFLLIFIAINLIIHISVKLNDKIQNELDIQNKELDESRSNLLNQNIQLKQFQDEILNQNEELKAFTEELQAKNELIESKNIELNVSYIYTRAIKNFLKNETNKFHEYFKDYFICDRPIAHVTSNLFWSRKINNKLYFILADANGNYASSSVLSVLIIKILNLVLTEEMEVLEFVDKIYGKIHEVHQESSSRRVSLDKVLDLSLCSLNMDTNELNIVTINQRIWISRADKLIEIKSTYNKNLNGLMKFSEEKIQLEPQDIIYLFTKSCVNQIGAGGMGRLTVTRFKQALLNIVRFPFNLQEEKLNNFMKEWRGNEKQTENMKFIAVKVD